MKINDLRSSADDYPTVLASQGVSCNQTVRGTVVEVEHRPGLYLLCTEVARDPMTSSSGQIRYFLVNLDDGHRVLQGKEEQIRCRVVDAVLNVPRGD